MLAILAMVLERALSRLLSELEKVPLASFERPFRLQYAYAELFPIDPARLHNNKCDHLLAL